MAGHTATPKGQLQISRQFAYNFIMKNRAAALATADDKGSPHVAVVYCVARKNLSLYFSTRVEGRKYVNLIKHPKVAMAFYNEKRLQMLQLTGVAKRVDELKLEQEILSELLKLRYQDPNWPLPPFKLFERGATNEIAIIQVTPKEMTFADFETGSVGEYKPAFQRII